MNTTLLDPRQQRGLIIAKSARLKQIVAGTWLVPSQSQANGGYVVDSEKCSCTCPDHETRAVKCKHQWAVEYVRHRVMQADGSPVLVETMRVTYRQNWPAYNAAQCEEKDRVQTLLKSLCDAIPNPVQQGRGRPRLPLSDVVFAATMKTFVGMSGRRATSDIRACAEKGHIDKAPSYNAIFDYLAGC